MSKAKGHSMNIFNILLKGHILYFKNMISLSKVMLFPVFGQVLGIIMILYPTYLITQKISNSLSAEALSNNMVLILLALILVTIPGFFIFAKAFWDYMISMIALNSMVGNIIKQGTVKDALIHFQTAKLKARDYVILLLLLTLIWIIGIFAPAILFLFQNPATFSSLPLAFIGIVALTLFVLIIVSIYLSLCFQVFTFENLSPVNTIKKSWNLVEGNFWRTFILGAVLAVITCSLIPDLFKLIIEKTALITMAIYPFKPYIATLVGTPGNMTELSKFSAMFGSPIISTAGSIYEISKIAALSSIGAIVTALLLPLGSACYTMLYFDITSKKNSKSKKK